MKDLSVIIVNYNVRHFLEQCLLSVEKALSGIDGEVWVVDNNSVDGSIEMVREKFPWVNLIENKKNAGFSAANNQAIRKSDAHYILLLNPDTVVEESTFTKSLQFMNDHPDAGALGVKMIDGKGRFLPESKRGLPTPEVAFYKIFGLQKLFSRSPRFGRYYLGHLDPESTNEVDVLSGAFMLLRNETLKKIGLLDEAFFMYGEDIDLSYRVTKGGWKNYYLPETRIIHYKGESTKKGSLNYVKVFYNAMIIFAQKHFSKGKRNVYIGLIRMAIYLRAGISVIGRIIKSTAFPLTESVLVYLAILGVKTYWEVSYKLVTDGIPYPEEFAWLAAPIYTFVFVSFLWALGAYRKPYRLRPILEAALSGFIAIATITYVFKDINYSRAIVALSSLAVALVSIMARALVNLAQNKSLLFTEEQIKRVIIVGDETESSRISAMILRDLQYPVEIEGAVFPEESRPEGKNSFLGTITQLREIVSIYRIDEVIFSGQSLSTLQILNLMSANPALQYKIVPPGADYLVGPQVIHSSKFAGAGFFNLSRKEIKRKKRTFDIAISTILLLTSPVLFWMYKNPKGAVSNLLHVLRGDYHLVGYIASEPEGLPKIKAGLLNMLHRMRKNEDSMAQFPDGLDRHYARAYSVALDLEILIKGIRKIGELRMQP